MKKRRKTKKKWFLHACCAMKMNKSPAACGYCILSPAGNSRTYAWGYSSGQILKLYIVIVHQKIHSEQASKKDLNAEETCVCLFCIRKPACLQMFVLLIKFHLKNNDMYCHSWQCQLIQKVMAGTQWLNNRNWRPVCTAARSTEAGLTSGFCWRGMLENQ